MGFWDAIGNALSRTGDVLSRPSYAAGNLLEALAYQANRPFLDQAGEDKIQGLVGDTNPLTALWGGLEGKDKVGPGDVLARTSRAAADEGIIPGWLGTALDNPATSIGTNIVTDPLVFSGSLGAGGKLSGALSNLGKGEDAGKFAQAAGRLLTPERVQNVNLAAKAIESNPVYTVPMAGVLGGARRFIPGVDEAVERLYNLGRRGRVAGEVDDVGRSLLPDIVERPVVGPPRPAINDLGEGLEPFVAAERVGQPLAVGSTPIAGELNAAPVVRPHGGPQAAAMNALESGPVPRELPMGARPMGGAAPEARMDALRKALTGKGDLSMDMRTALASGGKGVGTGRFLNKAVVQDAEQLRRLLNDPETRTQTLKMLVELMS